MIFFLFELVWLRISQLDFKILCLWILMWHLIRQVADKHWAQILLLCVHTVLLFSHLKTLCEDANDAVMRSTRRVSSLWGWRLNIATRQTEQRFHSTCATLAGNRYSRVPYSVKYTSSPTIIRCLSVISAMCFFPCSTSQKAGVRTVHAVLENPLNVVLFFL